MTRSGPITVKSFWEAVEARLAACTADDLRVVLREMAGCVAPEDRRGFIEQLQPRRKQASATKSRRKSDLVQEIEDFLAELEAAMESPGHDSWNDWHDEDSLGPYEEFVAPLTSLFQKVAAAFDGGDLKLARDAYPDLFEAFTLEDEYGRGIHSHDLDNTLIREAMARHLRAVYETSSAGQRPGELYDQLQKARDWGLAPRFMLADLLEISTRPLADWDAFLEQWMTFLDRCKTPDADAWLPTTSATLPAGLMTRMPCRKAGGERSWRSRWFSAW